MSFAQPESVHYQRRNPVDSNTHTHQASPVAVLLPIVFLYCQLKRWSSALQCTYWNLPLFSKRLRSPSHTDPGSGPSHPGHDSDTRRPDFGLKESEKERLSYSGPVRRRVRRYWPGGATHGASIEPWDGLIYMLTEHGRFPYSQRDKPTANKPLSERLGWQLLSSCSPPPASSTILCPETGLKISGETVLGGLPRHSLSLP